MYIHSVKLINYKSIGDYAESEVIIEPKITAIIGKNESGKSNVLDGLSKIDFIKSNPAAFAGEVVNRNSQSGTENKYIITLKPDNNEVADGLIADTEVVISKTQCIITGGFYDYYLNKAHRFFEDVVTFLDGINSNPLQLKDQELSNYRNYKQDFTQTEQLDTYRRFNAINFLHSRITRLSAEHRKEFEEKINIAHNVWFDLMRMFPVFYYRKTDKHLNTSYKIEDIEKEIKNPTVSPNSLLFNFVKLIGIPTDDFILAARSGSSAKQESLRRKINRLIEEKVNKPFYDFYQTERVTLDIGFNTGVVTFVVQTQDGEALMLSERSNGLKWYLETFIDAQANDINGANVVFLLDEPGTSLHVNAQRELLSLFKHLTENSNQVAYTTHSPYMLDVETEGVHRIRAVVKDEEGYSRIYKTAYDSRIAPDSQKDTLTPIINALGMNLNDTFGPAKDKINIVTEGMSDYIYICTMAKQLGVSNDKYAIIPSVGASNCVNLCSILHGWGCKYIAVFDYDKAGVESGGEYLRKNMFFEQGKQYCYMKEISQSEIDSKTYKSDAGKYMVEDLVTKEELDRFCSFANIDINIGKSLIAKLLSNAVEKGTYTLGKDCIENFRSLFARISTYVS